MADLPQSPLPYRSLEGTAGVYEVLVRNVTGYAIYMLDPDGRISTWNAGAERAKGYVEAEIVGRHFGCFYSAEDRLAGVPEANLQTARRAGKYDAEGWRRRKDGSLFWAHVVIDALRDESGQLLGFAKITRDCTEERRLREETLQHERRFRFLVEGITDYAIYMLDVNGIVSNWNAGAQRAKGYTADEIVGRHFSCFYSEEDQRAGLPARGLETARRESRFETEGWRLRKDGSRFWAHVVIDPIHDDSGALFGFAKITRDCTAQRASSLALQETTQRLDLALSNMLQGLCLFDATGRLALSNVRFSEILGVEAASLSQGLGFRGVLRAVLRRTRGAGNADLRLLSRHLQSHEDGLNEVRTCELRHLGLILSVSIRRLAQGGWLWTLEDVTARRKVEQRIEFLARHDTLTGLANRFDFQDRLKRLLASSSEASRFALLYLDLDRFKAINDMLGHHGGDQLLKRVALRLKGVLPGTGQLSRLGGDEFTILLMGCRRIEDAADVAQRCIRELTLPFDIAGHEVGIGVSIGIVMPSGALPSIDLVLQQADQAMYKAKQEGRNCHRVFESGMTDPQRRQNELEADLRRALIGEQLQLHYQPILDAETGETTGFEALLRWTHPTHGNMPPAEFIPMAEERNLMPAIGAWVLRRACTDALGWPVHIRVAVNVSPMQLLGEEFTALLDDVIGTTGLAPNRLELEITETTLIGRSEVPRNILRRAREMGIGVAMDDFGIGYSSLSLLQSFPFTRIKIDRSFVQGIGSNPNSIAIVRSIIALCDSLDLPVIAEGVETEYQWQVLCGEKCRELQGFLFHRALPRAALSEWLARSGPLLKARSVPVRLGNR